MMMMAGAQGSVKQRGRKKAKDKTMSDWAFDREWCLTDGVPVPRPRLLFFGCSDSKFGF